MAFRMAAVCGLIGCVVLGAGGASAHPLPAYRHGHHRYHRDGHVDVDAQAVVPEGYAYGGYERGLPPLYPPGNGPGFVRGAGYFIAPGYVYDGY